MGVSCFASKITEAEFHTWKQGADITKACKLVLELDSRQKLKGLQGQFWWDWPVEKKLLETGEKVILGMYSQKVSTCEKKDYKKCT